MVARVRVELTTSPYESVALPLSYLAQHSSFTRRGTRFADVVGQARRRGLTSLRTAAIAFTKNSFSGCGEANWGDLPGLNRRLRTHIPRCCRYTKITIDWQGRLDSNQGHPPSE